MATPGSELRVELLGPVRARSGTRDVPLGSSRPQAVFAMLAMRAGRAVHRDELIDGVWGEDVPATAVGSLYTYISALRTSLEPERGRGAGSGLLVSSGSAYRLLIEPDQLDVVHFERQRECARRYLADGDAAEAMQRLDVALGLWQGDAALSGVHGPFADGQRSRLEELRIATAELRGEAALAAGLHADLVGEFALLVREHPLREAPHALLMLALHRCGRSGEALEAYRDAHRVWVAELGMEPGARLRRLRDQILVDDPALRAPDRDTVEVRANGAFFARGAPTGTPLPDLLGRDAELALVHEAVRAVADGRGGSLWIEGEMGIGKSAVIAACLARAESTGCHLAHAVADELGQRFPLGVMLDCLQVNADASDPRRAAIWSALREEPGRSLLGGGDPVFGAIDRMVALVEESCAAGPLVLALDDLQWADEASSAVWHRLCAMADRLPLLLVGASRPVPHRAVIDRLRDDVHRRAGHVIYLTPLSTSAVEAMIGNLIGASPGPGLRAVAARAAGNPLFVREIAEALVRDRVVEVASGTADVPTDAFDRAPVTLIAAVTGRLGYLSDQTREVLRWATVLGGDFTVGELSVVVGRPVRELVPPLDEAFAAGVLRDAGDRLAFRHPVIRQALYEGTASALRIALHHQAAKALADAGAPVEQIAEQIVAVAGEVPPWVTDWLVSAASPLIYRAPVVATELLHRAVDAAAARDPRRAVLMAQLSSVLFRIGRDPEAEEYACCAMPLLGDANLLAEMRWILAYVRYRASRAEEALTALGDALADPALPTVWRARLTSLLALVQRAGIGELDLAAESARTAVDLGERADDPFSIGYALEVLWQVDAVRRDYATAVGHLDRALAVVGADISLADLRLVLLDNRMFTLQCLDRLDDAGADLKLAREIAGHSAPAAGLHVAAAVHAFWLGDWDDALAELSTVQNGPGFTGFGLREGGPALLLHGVGALIAVHRDDGESLRTHLQAGMNLPHVTAADRENCDFLIAARAMAAARSGDPGKAIALLDALLNAKDSQMMLRHQWFPSLVRLAVDGGDSSMARAATEACEAEAAQETARARAAAAARRCRSLLDGDPDALRDVIDHYRKVGRMFELAQTVEDQAVLLDRAGRAEESAAALREAMSLYRRLGAVWDLRRTAERGEP